MRWLATRPDFVGAEDPVAEDAALRFLRLVWGDPGSACPVAARSGLGAKGAAALAAAVAALRVGTRGTLAVLAPRARATTRDEALLLDAIGSLQRGEPWRAQRAVAEWVPPDLAVRVIALLAKASAAMARAGLRPGRLEPDRIAPRPGSA
ncbi:MAG: hypothetical protein SNJ73_09185 [Acetobacteraceae bacterium]